uniref:Uncharacterized protein n=2 Tax=Ditylum brightwellii TaxID=49249 RepID=A0A7S4QF01_9STRA
MKGTVIAFASSPQRNRRHSSIVSSPRILSSFVILLIWSSVSCFAFSPTAKVPQHVGKFGEDLMSQRWMKERPLSFRNNEISKITTTSISSNLFLSRHTSLDTYLPSSKNAMASLAFASLALLKSSRKEGGTMRLFGTDTNDAEGEGQKLSPFRRAASGVLKAITSVLRFFFVKPLLWLKSLFTSTDDTKKDDETTEVRKIRKITPPTDDLPMNATVATEVVTAALEEPTNGETLLKETAVMEELTNGETLTEESVADLEANKDEALPEASTEKDEAVLVEDDEEASLTAADNLAVDEKDAGKTSITPLFSGNELPFFAYVREKAPKIENDPMAVFQKVVSQVTQVMEKDVLPEKVSEVVAEKESKEVEAELAPLVLPKGERWAVSHPDIDLSGDWKVVVSEDFKSQYDAYLRSLGQPQIVRSVALSIIGMTREHTAQEDSGRKLYIKGTNARGIWERTLKASGADFNGVHDYELGPDNDHKHGRVSLITADSEKVEAEAWWENNGKVHISWLRGGKKYGGGDFESRRYLENEGKILVCESKFHPHDEGREKAAICWKFERTR